MSRIGRVERTTKETSVLVEIDLDGTGKVDVSTGVGFYDHMLDQLGRHGLFDLTVKTEGDLHIDSHHTIEDTALALGAAFKQALGDKVGIYRFGNCTVPLDESLAQVTVDLSGRPYLVHTEPENMAPMIGEYDTTMTRHILESFVAQAQIALHVHVPYGRNAHHIVECQFKALARALRYASRARPARGRDPSFHQGRAVTGLSTAPHPARALPAGGVYSFVKQKHAQGVIVLLAIGAACALLRPGLVRMSGIASVTLGRDGPAGARDGAGRRRTSSSSTTASATSARPNAPSPAPAPTWRSPATSTRAMNADGLLVPGVGAFAACMRGLKVGPRRLDRRPPALRRPPGHGHLRRHADPLRARHRARRRDRGPRRVARHGRAAQGRRSCRTWAGTPSGRRRLASSSPASTTTRASTSCTPTPSTTGTWTSPTPHIRAPRVTWSTHGEPFVAAVENGALWATQFHPEKSGDAGAQLLTNWIGTL